MDEIMEMLHDYVSLLAHIATGETLSHGERARLLALSRLLPGSGEPPEPSDEDERDDGMPVQITAPGGFESARLVAPARFEPLVDPARHDRLLRTLDARAGTQRGKPRSKERVGNRR